AGYIAEKLGSQGQLQENSIQVEQVIPPVEHSPELEQALDKTLGEKNYWTENKLSPKRKLGLEQKLSSNKMFRLESQKIAVIGMAGQFPESQNLSEFWQNIIDGRNCINQVERKRWDINSYYQKDEIVVGKSISKWMGALENYDCFDPIFFNISPIEAESMDPQQRLFLQSCWHSIENAGYNPQSLAGSKCGVFAGVGETDYLLLSKEQKQSAQGFTGGAASILAARISYFLDLKGPSISIDTACSSSLVAIANACDSLSSFNSDLALAGGVAVMATPEMHIKTSQSGMQSVDGRCFTFDQRANGFVLGEGVGVVLLKRFEDAQKDGDIIQGVIQGWGINQDGKTNGITAPNPESQTALQKEVYDKFCIDPNDIELIEAHGTGTKLGDPIEIEGLKESFKDYTDKKKYCALGSVKSNIGHCGASAGIAGFIKATLALRNQQLPPTINFERLNEHIELSDSPFYINSDLQDWKTSASSQRLAAISSFGFSGTNAHLVVGEYQESGENRKSAYPISKFTSVLIPLSAKTDKQLVQVAADLLKFISVRLVSKEKQQGEVSSPKLTSNSNLEALAYTLQVGREPMEERLGIITDSLQHLKEMLEQIVSNKSKINNVFRGKTKENKEALTILAKDEAIKNTVVNQWVNTGDLRKLCEFWCKGLNFEWRKLYREGTPQRIELPGYPFAKERYWLAKVDSVVENSPQVKTETIHPLLHSKVSDLEQQGMDLNMAYDAFSATDYEPKLVSLPTYPFAKDRCWVDENSVEREISKQPNKIRNFESIEEIISQIESDSINEEHAVDLLNSLL
ncbi:MAG: type I polyketide synthase, partial [Kangiellaceae bacterium]|nr:type I polyketide synthase [Kangiellaceae bacterium]